MTRPTHERSWTHEGRPELNRRGRSVGPGPWNDEPDKVQWIDPATDLDCLAVRNGLGAWCGYVGLPPGHPFHGVGYSSCTATDCTEEWCYDHSPEGIVRVHGGLTFSSSCHESDKGEGFGICHTPFEGRPHDVWWLGFDCAHAGDYTPGLGDLYPEEQYRDLGYVKSECASLARQLAEVAS